MRSILAFFFIVSLSLVAGVYFYETQIASPNAADALVKSKKKRPAKKLENPAAVINKSSSSRLKLEATIVAPIEPSRVIDLLAYGVSGEKKTSEQKNRQREIEKSIRSTIKKLINLDIQKAVVAEISKKR